MRQTEDFVSLSELAKRWESYSIDLKKIIRLAGQGFLEVRVLAPDVYETKIDNEFIILPVDYSYEHRVIEPRFLQEMIGRGQERIEKGSVIQSLTNGQLITFRSTEFCDLVSSENEAHRFENEYLKKLGTNTIDANNSSKNLHEYDAKNLAIDPAGGIVSFYGETFTLTRSQIDCVKVIENRYKQYIRKEVETPDMPQREILREAKLAQNVQRIDQVFRNKEDAFKTIFKKTTRGRLSLNIK